MGLQLYPFQDIATAVAVVAEYPQLVESSPIPHAVRSGLQGCLQHRLSRDEAQL